MEFDWSTIVSIVGAFGGLELIKFLLNRRANSRHVEATADEAEAHADEAEIKAEKDKWELFKDMQHTLQEEVIKKDEVIANKDALYREQTNRLRSTQDELNNTLKELVEIKAKYIYADTWRCELGSCRKRKPPKPQLDGLEYDENKMPIENKNEDKQ